MGKNADPRVWGMSPACSGVVMIRSRDTMRSTVPGPVLFWRSTLPPVRTTARRRHTASSVPWPPPVTLCGHWPTPQASLLPRSADSSTAWSCRTWIRSPDLRPRSEYSFGQRWLPCRRKAQSADEALLRTQSIPRHEQGATSSRGVARRLSSQASSVTGPSGIHPSTYPVIRVSSSKRNIEPSQIR